jgi:hypothetical protein
MSMREILSDDAVMRLPPMLFGRIRWNKSLGAPVGDATTGFRVLVEEHTVSQFRMGPGGPEVVPGTGIWLPTVTVPCWAAPDEGDMHAVAFNVSDVHLNGFPDGQYHVKCELTGNWEESLLRLAFGFRRIEPLGYYRALTKEQHIVSLDFEVVLEPWRWRP